MVNLVPAFLRRKAAPEQPQSAVTLNSPGWLSSWGNGGVPLFGSSVNEETAMAVAALYRCVTLVSGAIASLDIGIFTDDPSGGQRIHTKFRPPSKEGTKC
jgi:phage portal protein BeeE